jgi:hypothetical protein
MPEQNDKELAQLLDKPTTIIINDKTVKFRQIWIEDLPEAREATTKLFASGTDFGSKEFLVNLSKESIEEVKRLIALSTDLDYKTDLNRIGFDDFFQLFTEMIITNINFFLAMKTEAAKTQPNGQTSFTDSEKAGLTSND